MLQLLCPIVLSILLDVSNPLTARLARYSLTLLPMSTGIALQISLKKHLDPQKNPFLSEFLHKFISAFNLVLAAPAVSPLTKELDKNLRLLLEEFDDLDGEKRTQIKKETVTQ